MKMRCSLEIVDKEYSEEVKDKSEKEKHEGKDKVLEERFQKVGE